MTCEACGSARKIHQHHHDYTKRDDTIPLCASCHRDVHNGSLPEPRTGRFYVKGEAYKKAGIKSPAMVAIDPKLLEDAKRIAKKGQRSLSAWANRAIEYAILLELSDTDVQKQLTRLRAERAP